ncbi:hypothetical protein Ndes2526A_g07543 [Nannochloris sp. 'desiccata']
MQKTICPSMIGSAVVPRAARINQLRRPAFCKVAPRTASVHSVAMADCTVIQELLVQQHLFRWNKNYKYSEVTALGVCSIFDQVLAGLPDGERDEVFTAFITALQEDPKQYRADASKLEEWARGASPEAVTPNADGSEGQKVLAKVAEACKANSFLYTKFFAIGLFRMLELAGGKDPKALGAVVAALGIPQERVNADLLTYKGVLSKLKAAKEIMKEFIEREKRKTAERGSSKGC